MVVLCPKVVLNNYDLLMSIYGGCAATEPLVFGIQSTTGDWIDGSNENMEDDDVESDMDDNEGENENIETVAANNHRKRKAACPTLIDNKRKNMEKSLSAAQRDKILMSEYKHDIKNRKDMLEVIRGTYLISNRCR